jgi:N-acetylmuramoyl-L-alanine amidase
LYPWVRGFTLEALRDRYRITVTAEGPLSYESGELEDPPRIYLDLLSVDLAQIPSEFGVADSYLRGARIHQHSVSTEDEEEVARVVVELEEWRPYRIRESGDRCELEIELPLPEAVELPPDVPAVILTELSFARESPQLAAVTVGVFGTPYCTSIPVENPPLVFVDIANATSQCRAPALGVDDRLVSGVTLGPAPGKPGTQRLTVHLRDPVGHAVVTETGAIKVLVGRFELGQLKLVIDAGHGGHDTGAIGRSGLREKDVNLDIARRVYRRLQAMGVNVVLTRRDDNPAQPWTRGNSRQHRRELLRRCEIANEMGADLFVSIHANARESNPSEHRGTETFYREPNSRGFARVLQEEVVRAAGLPDGGTKRHPKSIVVLSYSGMPAALVEVCGRGWAAAGACAADARAGEAAGRLRAAFRPRPDPGAG